MPLTLLQRMVLTITDIIDHAYSHKEISLKQKQALYKSLFYMMMGEPHIIGELGEFCRKRKKDKALTRLFNALGSTAKMPQALYSRIVQSVSLKNVQRTWDITKSDIDMINHMVKQADIDPHDEFHLLHRDYPSEEFDWIAEVERRHEVVEIILDSQALEDMLLGVFETYKVPKSKHEPFSEVFGLCLGMASSNRVAKRGTGATTKWFVYVEKAVPQIRAKAGPSSVVPSSKSIRALIETSNSLFPQLEIIGDYHSHPYRTHRQLKSYRGWEASKADAGSTQFLYRSLKASPERTHRMRVSFVIAIAKGRAFPGGEIPRTPNVLRMNMAGCHIYLSAYRILSDGSMTNEGVILRRPFRETYLKSA